MIKYNGSNINDWHFYTSDIVKVYRNGAVVYYKVTSSGSTPTFDVCYAVVDDISQYQETEFEDVFNKADEKWYKLNNLNQYEEYGVYGNGRNITYYEGKLTVDDGYEYQYSGSSWVNVGEVSGSSRVPEGYTEVEYIQNSTTGTNYYIDTQFKPNQDTRVIFEAQPSVLNNNPRMFGSGPWNSLAFVGNIENTSPQKFYFKYGQTSSWYTTNVQADTNKHTFDLNKNSYYIDGVLANTASTSTFQLTTNLGIFNAPSTSLFNNAETFIGKVFSCKIYDNGTLIRDYVPCKRDSDSKSGLFDIVNDVFYTAVNTSYNFSVGAEASGQTEYPLYYDEKSDPLNNLSFSSMTEATEYAYNNCVYDGMQATIDGDRYYFDSEDENGWVENPSKLPSGYTEVEYVQNTGTSYINTNLQIYSSTTNSFEIESKLIAAKHDSQTYQNVFSCISEDGEPYQGFTYRYQSSSLVGTSIPNGQNTFTIVNNEDSTQTVTVTSSTSQRTYTHTYPLTLFCGLNSSRSPFRWTNSKFYYCKIKINDELVRDLVPCKRDSDDKYGMYDLVTNTFYVSPNNVDFSGGDPV